MLNLSCCLLLQIKLYWAHNLHIVPGCCLCYKSRASAAEILGSAKPEIISYSLQKKFAEPWSLSGHDCLRVVECGAGARGVNASHGAVDRGDRYRRKWVPPVILGNSLEEDRALAWGDGSLGSRPGSLLISE